MHKQILLSLTLLVTPSLATSAGLLTVPDSIAGLGTTVTLRAMPVESSVTLRITPPLGPEVVREIVADPSGTAATRIEGSALQVAGTYTVTAQAGEGQPIRGSFTVAPDTVDPMGSTIDAGAGTLTADGADATTVRIVVRDRYGNPVHGRRMQLISNRSSDTIAALTGETDASGEQLFSVQSSLPGVIDLRAMDLLSGKLITDEAELSAKLPLGMGGYGLTSDGRSFVAPMHSGYATQSAGTYTTGRRFFGQVGTTFDVIHHFEVRLEGDSKEVAVYDPLSLEIHAMDRNGNIVEDYTGTAQLFTTDPEALVPNEVRFTPSDFGVKKLSLSLRFQSAGQPNAIGEPTHVIRVEEPGTCSTAGSTTCVFGELEVIVSNGNHGAATEKLITLVNPLPNATVSGEAITVTGKGPPFINLNVTGGIQTVSGGTDENGAFAIAIQLDSRLADHKIRVKDPSGKYDTGDIIVHLDNVAPTIGAAVFDPSTPEQGTPVSIRAQAEEKLSSLKLIIGSLETPLTESAAEAGIYAGVFSVANAGPIIATLKAVDAAGNTAESQVQFTVSPPALPTVTGLRATPKIEQVDLAWDAITDQPVDGYRIYIGTDTKNYSSYLDSPDKRGGATVGGLKPGTMYYFAVTALQGERESKTKSIEISGTPKGLTLDITPQDGSLVIEWSSLDTDLPLSSFTLEYGVDGNDYSEKRILNGELRAFALRDLLNDVTYHLRLTPITTTGQALEDLAAEGQGTPSSSGNGFKPTAADPIPFQTGITSGGSRPTPPPFHAAPPPSETIHSGAPSVPSVGIPPIAWWLAIILSCIAFFVHYQRRKTLQMTLQFLGHMEKQYRMRE